MLRDQLTAVIRKRFCWLWFCDVNPTAGSFMESANMEWRLQILKFPHVFPSCLVFLTARTGSKNRILGSTHKTVLQYVANHCPRCLTTCSRWRSVRITSNRMWLDLRLVLHMILSFFRGDDMVWPRFFICTSGTTEVSQALSTRCFWALYCGVFLGITSVVMWQGVYRMDAGKRDATDTFAVWPWDSKLLFVELWMWLRRLWRLPR